MSKDNLTEEQKAEAAAKAQAKAAAAARPVAAYDISHGVEGAPKHYAPGDSLSHLSKDELDSLKAAGCVRMVVPGDVDAEGEGAE